MRDGFPRFCRSCRTIYTARRKYALFETDKAVVIMSLSGAAKRIEFNEITESKEAPASQRILIPNTVKFERGDAEYFKLNIDSLKLFKSFVRFLEALTFHQSNCHVYAVKLIIGSQLILHLV